MRKNKVSIKLFISFVIIISLLNGLKALKPIWMETYPKGSFETTSPYFSLIVGEKKVDVVLYFSKPKANRIGYSYAHFAYEGTGTFEITCLKGNVEAVDASPHSYNMVINISGNKITFNLAQKKSRYMVFDIRAKGETYQLIIAADPNLNLSPPKTDGTKVINAKDGMKDVVGGLNSSNDAKSGKSNTEKIQKILKKLSENGGGTLYFPEGVYPFTTINAESNVSIYLDGGAILRGSGIRTDYNWATTGANGIQIKERDIRIKNVKNFKIIGKGMIDANSIVLCQKGKTSSGSRELNNDPQPDDWYPDGWNDYRKGIVDGDNADGIEFKGITFKDSTGWTFNIRKSKNIIMDNVKMLDDYTVVHSDGYDLVSCQDVKIRNCLGVCGDDVFCPKGDIKGHDMKNYLFQDSVAYAQGGAGCKIGVQASSNVYNIEFNNIDVIKGYRGFSVAHDTGEGTWDGIYFRNIRTEKLHIPSFSNADANHYGQYTATPFTIWLLSNGAVKNVEVTNCSFESISKLRAMIKGKSDNGKLSQVTFNNLVMDGRTVESLDDHRLSVGNYVDRGSFKFKNDKVYKATTIILEAEKAKLDGAKVESGDKGRYSGDNKVGNIGFLNGKENTVTFEVDIDNEGDYNIEVYPITKGSRAFYITLNNEKQQILMCNGDNFNTQGRTFTKLHLKKGKNILKFSNPNDAAPDLDKIEIVKSGELLGSIQSYTFSTLNKSFKNLRLFRK